MKRELTTLANGLECLFIHASESTIASVQVWFRAGSALEKGADLGIAHFLEHMFFKGTTKRPGSSLVEEIESLGGEINAFTSFDYTCYYINAPCKHTAKACDILLDMVTDPSFKKNELLAERDVVFEEWRRSLDSPDHTAFHKMQGSCFTGGYAHPILGTGKTIASFSKDQLIAFRRSFYHRQSAFLLVAGPLVKQESLVKTIESYHLPSGDIPTLGRFTLKKTPTFDIHHKEVATTTFHLFVESVSLDSPSAPAEDLAINALGHGESSPFHQALVFSSLANSVSSSTLFMHKGGVHSIKITLPLANLTRALNVVRKILEDRAQRGFLATEVGKIKNQYLASKIFNRESLDTYAFHVAHSFIETNNIDGDYQFINRVKKTNLALVNQALREVFKRPLHLGIQVPEGTRIHGTEKSLRLFQEGVQKCFKKIPPPLKKYPLIKSRHDQALVLVPLTKGIRFLYRKNDLCPSFFLEAYIKGGQIEESKERAGLYHILSSMLTKGYGKIDQASLKREFEEKSASLSSFSGKNAYGIGLHGLSDYWEDLIPHFFGGLLAPSFDKSVFQTTKDLILRGIDKNEKNPAKRCFTEAAKLFFNGHPYALPNMGTKKTLGPMRPQALRKFHTEQMAHKEMLFTYCGDRELEDVLTSLKGFISKLGPRARRKRITKKISPCTVTSFIPFDREQAHLLTGVSTKGQWAQEHFVFKFLTTYLSGQSSPLFLEVRDRLGLCYSVGPIHHVALDGGYWGIYMASGHDKVTRALEAIRGVIQRIQGGLITKSDFATIKTMIRGQQILGLQTNEDYAHTLSPPILHGRGIDHVHTKNKALENLSYGDFLKGASKLLARPWATVIVGRKKH